MEQVDGASNCMQRSVEVWWNIRKHTVRKQPCHGEDRERWSVVEPSRQNIILPNLTHLRCKQLCSLHSSVHCGWVMRLHAHFAGKFEIEPSHLFWSRENRVWALILCKRKYQAEQGLRRQVQRRTFGTPSKPRQRRLNVVNDQYSP